jgi:nickel-dependent lactate racemase
MVEIWLPYGETEVYISVDMRNILDEARLEEEQPRVHPREILTQALSVAEDTFSQKDMKDPDFMIVIGLQGTIPPLIAPYVISVIVEELEETASREQIKLIIGNGIRERSNPRLLQELNESGKLEGIEIFEHTSKTTKLIELGSTEKGTPIHLNPIYNEAAMKIAVGEVKPDIYTGYTGAHTAIIPGMVGEGTIEANRRHYFQGVDPGVLEGNTVKEDAFEVVKQVGVDLAINLFTNSDGRLLEAYAGVWERSWDMALDSIKGMYELEIENNADIVVVSAGGIAHDHDLYNASWSLRPASKIARRNGTIILVAECIEGMGPDGFIDLAHVDILSELERRYQLGAEMIHMVKTIGRQQQLILVSTLPDYFIEPLGFESARSANEAYNMALNRRGKKTVFIPYGCSTIPA